MISRGRRRQRFPRLAALAHLTVVTHKPDKYRVVDLETGDVWRAVHDGTGWTWKRARDLTFTEVHPERSGG